MKSIDEHLSNLTPNDSQEVLAKAVHTYVNYEEIAKKAEQEGFAMKESRDHYEYIILRELEKLFKGKNKIEISLKIFSLFN
ncbi:MAG: hypothetical protein IJ272_04815 [Clostridia bacterium]|nr:hypothetical protein [Clostridia bacterium]